MLSNGNFLMKLTGPGGSFVVLQKSTDLKNWIPVQTNTLPTGGLDLSVPAGTNRWLFFRAKASLQLEKGWVLAQHSLTLDTSSVGNRIGAASL